eukprot:165723-Hanusia_phi.AAC.1
MMWSRSWTIGEKRARTIRITSNKNNDQPHQKIHSDLNILLLLLLVLVLPLLLLLLPSPPPPLLCLLILPFPLTHNRFRDNHNLNYLNANFDIFEIVINAILVVADIIPPLYVLIPIAVPPTWSSAAVVQILSPCPGQAAAALGPDKQDMHNKSKGQRRGKRGGSGNRKSSYFFEGRFTHTCHEISHTAHLLSACKQRPWR